MEKNRGHIVVTSPRPDMRRLGREYRQKPFISIENGSQFTVTRVR
jgi:hypothetical protein